MRVAWGRALGMRKPRPRPLRALPAAALGGEPDPLPSLLLCHRGRAGPRASAGRADLGDQRTRGVCETEKARRL